MTRWAPPAGAVALGLAGVVGLAACGSGDAPPRRAGVPIATSYAAPSSEAAAGSAPGASTAELAGLRAAAALEPCPTATQPASGSDLPDLLLPCLGEGPPVRLSQLRGPLVLSLWGSWCAPCLAEMPVLQDFHERAAGQVAVLGVNIVDADESALRYAAERSVRYPSVVDADGALRAGLPRPLLGAPWTLLVDGDGRVVHYASGQVESADELAGLVARYLGVRV